MAALEEAVAAAAAMDRPLAALAYALEAAIDRARAEGIDVAAAEAQLASLRLRKQQVDRTIAQVRCSHHPVQREGGRVDVF